MKRLFLPLLLLISLFVTLNYYRTKQVKQIYGAPPYIEEGPEPEQFPNIYNEFSNWVRPEGPIRVGLQVGHWKNSELPEELKKLIGSTGGTSRNAVPEWEVNLSIAEETKIILEEQGIVVDILPATVPVNYYADAFVAIHADGNADPSTAGFKVAAPRRDMSGKAGDLVKVIEETYQKQTSLDIDPNISRNMTGYYAFNWRRYQHAIHPMTPAVILETGFLTNPQEAKMLINNPKLPASALADALITFLK
jgi:hypothetical protein